jgi:hypothetical protein
VIGGIGLKRQSKSNNSSRRGGNAQFVFAVTAAAAMSLSDSDFLKMEQPGVEAKAAAAKLAFTNSRLFMCFLSCSRD